MVQSIDLEPEKFFALVSDRARQGALGFGC